MKPTKEAPIKRHFHMGTLELTFDLGESNHQTKLNVVIETRDGNVTRRHLEQIQQTAIGRLCEQFKVAPDSVTSLVILNISHLGCMAKDTFFQESAPVANNIPA